MSARPPVVMCLALALLGSGCQEPFDAERHRLGPFRLAAMGVEDGVASAVVWSGLGQYHDHALTLTWTLDGRELGQGWGVAVDGDGVLALHVVSDAGDEAEGQVTVSEGSRAAAPLDSVVAAVELPDSLSLDERRDVAAGNEGPVIAPGLAARVSVGGVDGRTLRWMVPGGTVLELDESRADLLAEDVTFEDGEVSARAPIEAGLYTTLVLAIDGLGRNSWRWVDVAMGVEGTWVRHDGRMIPADAAPTGGRVAGTLVLDDAGIGGLQMVDVVGVDDLSTADTLACAPSDEAFRFSWVAQGRCTRDELVGARVVLDLR